MLPRCQMRCCLQQGLELGGRSQVCLEQRVLSLLDLRCFQKRLLNCCLMLVSSSLSFLLLLFVGLFPVRFHLLVEVTALFLLW